MRLFTIGPDFQAELNKDWLSLIPEFNVLLKRDKGSKGDYRGEKKLKARKEFTFIYLNLDFTSPLKEYDEFERREIAIRDAGLTEADIDAEVMAAHERYWEMLQHSSRSLQTLTDMKKGISKLNEYFRDIDFTKVDKQGKLLHSPKEYLNNLKLANDAFDAIDKFEDRVKQELSGDGGIRGNASLGGKEGKRDKTWSEAPAPTETEQQPETVPATDFKAIGDMIAGIVKEEEE
jgi:hypothetical protein